MTISSECQRGLACGRDSAKVVRDQAAKLEQPAADSLVRGIDAALSKHFLDIAEGQREAGIEPDSVEDHSTAESDGA